MSVKKYNFFLQKSFLFIICYLTGKKEFLDKRVSAWENFDKMKKKILK